MRRLAVVLTLFGLLGGACAGDTGTSDGTGTSTTAGGGTTTTVPGEVAAEPAVAWVSDFAGGQVARIDLDGPSCQTTPAGLGADLVAFGLGRVWVTDCPGQQLLAIDPDTGEVVGRRDIGGCASDIAIGESSVFVTVPDTSLVLEIDAATGEILSETAVEGPPSAIALGSQAVGTFDGMVFYESAATRWDHAFAGVIYDLQFYAGVLWVLEVEFTGADYHEATSRIWAIDPAVGEPVLYDEVPNYLNGILVTRFGIWSNSLAGDEVAWWDDDEPEIGPAPVEPRWAAADVPTKMRLAGDDAFTTHHSSQRVTQIDQEGVGHDWGALRNGAPPSLWDQPATRFYDLAALCGENLSLADVAGATAAELEAARALAAGYPAWDSDPAPEGPPSRIFFAECAYSTSAGTLTASGTLEGADQGMVVELSVTGADGVEHALGSTAVAADGSYAFEPVTPTVAFPYTAKVTVGAATCETPLG